MPNGNEDKFELLERFTFLSAAGGIAGTAAREVMAPISPLSWIRNKLKGMIKPKVLGLGR